MFCGGPGSDHPGGFRLNATMNVNQALKMNVRFVIYVNSSRKVAGSNPDEVDFFQLT
jgi:hypothetical protein